MKRAKFYFTLFSILLFLFASSCNKEDSMTNADVADSADRDKDGIVDNLDDCPNDWGPHQFNGCPDTDGDGINDSKDNCPNEVGDGGVYHGCPWWKVDVCSGNSFGIRKTNKGKIIRWSNPKAGFYYGENLPTAYRQLAYDATASWQQYSTGSKFVLVTYGPPQNGIVSQNGRNVLSYGNVSGNHLAETITWYNNTSGAIVEVDIRISNVVSWVIGAVPGYYDLKSVIVHELGHFCGLGDLYSDSDRGQTMYGYLNDNSIIPRTLCDGDKAGMKYLYP